MKYLIIFLIIFQLGCPYSETKEIHTDGEWKLCLEGFTSCLSIHHFDFENHKYIMFIIYNTEQMVVHDPECEKKDLGVK